MTSPSPGPPPATLVGRERELAALRDLLTAALNGRGSLVLIGGEAGIGKSALAETLCHEAIEQGALVLTGRAFDLAETPPYGPWIDLFAHYHPTDNLPPPPAPFAERGTVSAVPNQATLFHAVLDFCIAVAALRPLIILLEDAHWQDAASLDLLRFLAREIATLPVLLLVTYRLDELTRRHPLYTLMPLLVRESGAHRIDLHALEKDVVRALVRARYALSDGTTDRLVSYLQARAEGNALFVGETLRTLEEEGVLARVAGGWRLGDLVGVAVSPLLRQVIDARIARLGDEAQGLLGVAAVIGQEVPLAVWGTVAGVDEETLLDLAERAQEAHLLTGAPDGAAVRFAHALIREALYEGVVPLRRARLHRTVADTLLAQSAPDPDALVYHLRQAHDPRLGHWLVEAGERAFLAYAQATAVARYEEALPLLVAPDAASQRHLALIRLLTMRLFEPASLVHGEEAVRVAEGLGDPERVASTLERLGFARAFNSDIPTGLRDQERAVAILAAHPAAASQAFDQSGNATAIARGTLAFTRSIVGQLREARALATTGALAANGHFALANSAALLGEPEAAHAALMAVLATLAATDSRNRGTLHAIDLVFVVAPYHTDDPARVREVAAAAAMAYERVGEAVLDFPHAVPQVAPLLLHGRWEEARAYLPLARRFRHSVLSDVAAFSLYGMLVRAQGERALGWEMVREMFPAGPETAPGAVPLRYALAMQRLGAGLALDAGDLATAREWLEMHDEWLAWSGAVLGLSEGHALWAQSYRQVGETEEARVRAERARAHATEPRQPLALLAAHRLLGELDTEAGRYDAAARHLSTSLDLADSCEAPNERALTLLAMAELRAATGERDDAVRRLDEVRALCEPLGARPTLDRADALTQHLASIPVASPAFPSGLSAREVEVLRLVAHRLTNPQVAQRLFLSPRTVEQHLRSIYNKCAVTTRAAAAAFAFQHGLA